MARKLAVPSILWDAMWGMVLAAIMMIVMGLSHMGFTSLIKIGMPAFVFTITPPASAMNQLSAVVQSGHINTARAQDFGTMLFPMYVPMAEIQMMGLIMAGHATNAAVTSLMKGMTPSGRALWRRCRSTPGT